MFSCPSCNGLRACSICHGRAFISVLEKKLELAKALEHQRPMCPDHRDKFSHVNCIACHGENTQRQLKNLLQDALILARNMRAGAISQIKLESEVERIKKLIPIS